MSTGATAVGGTAFVPCITQLSFTASLKENWSVATEQRVLQNLVRPSLEIGDLLLFDCRILHFGLANSSKEVERPLLYTNMTHAWFHDPKIGTIVKPSSRGQLDPRRQKTILVE
jgi:ectoine hydroxylase-related dioxygenase (phytanoyl-CoA dioxygenase family)